MTALTASARGRANRAKGATAERHLVAWLRGHGWPGAERAVRTGYRTTTRIGADPGDITGTPGLVWQVKNRSDFDQPAVLAGALAETEVQRVAENADYGLLIQRRTGHADPGQWWAWLRLGALVSMARHEPPEYWVSLTAPVRMELWEVVPLLRGAGYGTAS